MTLLFEVPAWHDHAACRDYPKDIFYPDKHANAGRARRICHGCPVKAECLTWALEHDELGIWGGTSEKDRRGMR